MKKPARPIRDEETSSAEVESLAYEAALTELEALVARLEATLDEALQLYERGQALAAHCGRLLERAELRLRELTPGAEDTDNA